jgi:hypothetical protein
MVGEHDTPDRMWSASTAAADAFGGKSKEQGRAGTTDGRGDGAGQP